MDYTDAVLEFLAREENLPIALEIADLVEQLKPWLHQEFWFAFRDRLQDLLVQSEWANSWVVQMTDRSGFLSNYAACFLVPSPDSRGRHYLRVALQQSTPRESYRLCYGTLWNMRSSTRPNFERVTDLVQELQQQGFQSNDLWLGYRYLDHYLESRDFMLRMATDRQDYIEGLFQTLWMFFEDKLEQIQAVNQAFVYGKDSGA